MLDPQRPALALAPMDGVTDAPLRALVGEWGAFDWAVTEFLRVSVEPIPKRVFLRQAPELANGGATCTGMPVQVQILGGEAERMAISAGNAVAAGATAIDINFGCPAPTVNRNDGGATLLRFPCRIEEIVRAVRAAVPVAIPVSAKLRLGWEDIDDVFENAARAIAGGASWITLHARTRVQRYEPPVFWRHVGRVREMSPVPVIANGDIFSLDDFRRCRDETGAIHFMIGRGALARPELAGQIRAELGLPSAEYETDWVSNFRRLVAHTERLKESVDGRSVHRVKQWLNIARRHGDFDRFADVKRIDDLETLLAALEHR